MLGASRQEFIQIIPLLRYALVAYSRKYIACTPQIFATAIQIIDLTFCTVSQGKSYPTKINT